MPAYTTSRVVLQTSATNTAGGTTTGSWVAINTTAGGLACMKITNGGTGPTVGCSGSIDVSPDNGTTIYLDHITYTALLASGGIYTHSVPVTPGTMYIRSRFTGNTAQDVTVQADLMALTGTA